MRDGIKVCIVFEGRDTAGKGGVIKRITERVSPRVFRVVALPAPTEREKSQMYVQRYLPHFPAAGEVVIFDRSWYNRAGVERVMGFCSEDEAFRFLRLVPLVERAMVDSGIILLKYWLEVGQGVIASGVYVRSLSCRNRRPRAGSGGGPAKRYVRSSTTSTTSSRKALSADPQPARRRRGRSRPHELVPVPAYGRPSSGPLGSQVSSARELPGPPTSLTDTRAADFPAPVAPLTFLPRCSRLMSFLSYILGASTWRG